MNDTGFNVSTSDNHVWWYDVLDCVDSDTKCYSQWQTIHIVALIPGIISILASTYIIITGIVYHSQFTSLTFGAKLPIYISIADLIFEINHSADHLHNLITKYVSEGALCTVFGSMKPYGTNAQTTWSLGTALYLHRIIRNRSQIDPTFGKNNIFLHIFCWGIPAIISIIGFIFDAYGIEGPWCGIPDPTIDLWMVDIWMFMTFIILVFLYGFTGYYLLIVLKKNLSGDSENYKNARKQITKVLKQFGLYPIAYLMQWLAYGLYKLWVIPRTYETTLWVVATGNCGGMFNLCLYYPLLFNQVKRGRKKIEKHAATIVQSPPNTRKSKENKRNDSHCSAQTETEIVFSSN